MPLRREGISKGKCFLIGQFSGMVEPIAGIIGVIFALKGISPAACGHIPRVWSI